jgi:hypothetical protein
MRSWVIESIARSVRVYVVEAEMWLKGENNSEDDRVRLGTPNHDRPIGYIGLLIRNNNEIHLSNEPNQTGELLTETNYKASVKNESDATVYEGNTGFWQKKETQYHDLIMIWLLWLIYWYLQLLRCYLTYGGYTFVVYNSCRNRQ